MLACDGIWDVRSNEKCVEFLSAELKDGKTHVESLEKLFDKSVCENPKRDHGGSDNMTAILIKFKTG